MIGFVERFQGRTAEVDLNDMVAGLSHEIVQLTGKLQLADRQQVAVKRASAHALARKREQSCLLRVRGVWGIQFSGRLKFKLPATDKGLQTTRDSQTRGRSTKETDIQTAAQPNTAKRVSQLGRQLVDQPDSQTDNQTDR